MSKLQPSDFSVGDVLDRLCPGCGIAPADLADLDFPRADYVRNGARFWRETTLRPWVRLRSESEIRCDPIQLRRLAGMVRSLKAWAGAPVLSDEEAMKLAVRQWVDTREKLVFGS